MADYRTTDLFGGAIVASLPSNFGDVSDIRQVPDNQEIYLDRDGFTSIVIEILERVDLPSDGEALRYHLEDLVGQDDAASTQVWSEAAGLCAHLSTAPVHTLFATAPPGERQRGRPHEPDFVGISLTVIRLETQKTDLLIAINVPHIAGSYTPGDLDPSKGQAGPLLQHAAQVRDKILQTFEIRDWDLFVTD